MTTGNAVDTGSSQYLRPVLEEGIYKILDSIDCKNIYTAELPPLTTEQDFVNKLQVNRGLAQPEYEGWFMHRRTIASTDSNINSYNQYNTVHGIMIIGLAYHGTFDESYKYMQDKGEQLFWTLEKNKDILGDGNIKFIDSLGVRYSFEQFGEMYMYRSETTFDVHRVVNESLGRSYSG
tara:strand:- start:5554 stop:6087 length:534 start_codon:yes stop_codon:yes gene_type:complete